MGGDSATAQPFIERFLRYLEGELGWPAASIKGSFLSTRREATTFVTGTQPGIGMLDPQLYFEMRKDWNLQPILQVESADLYSKKLNVVVKDPAISGLSGLAGRKLWTTLADYPKYLGKVVLDGKVDPSTITLKHIGQALKGVRGVLRGDCDATVLDNDQLAKAREIPGAQDLRVIHSSAALPPIPVVVFGTGLSGADKDALAKALLAMCGSAKGAPICKEMFIGRFKALDKAAFGDAEKKMGE
jgi:ABC-type phosphate/phosphonate transport system substrate-binding protein